MPIDASVNRSTAPRASCYWPFHSFLPSYFFFGPPSGVPINEAAPRSLTPTIRSILPKSCWLGTAFPDSISAIYQVVRTVRFSPDQLAGRQCPIGLSGPSGPGPLTSCGFAFTAVARSFCVILFPSGLVFAALACASALPTLTPKLAHIVPRNPQDRRRDKLTRNRPSRGAWARHPDLALRSAGGPPLQRVTGQRGSPNPIRRDSRPFACARSFAVVSSCAPDLCAAKGEISTAYE